MKAEAAVAGLLIGVAAGGVGFAAAVALRAGTQLIGLCLVFAAACLAAALAVWAKELLPREVVCDPRDELPGPPAARAEIEASFGGARDPFARRTLLSSLLFGAAGVLGAALLFPLRSFGRNPAPYRAHSAWKAGMRAVREDGTPVRAADLEVGTVFTVFPEGKPEDSLAQTLLIRVEPGLLQLPPDKLAVAPGGLVAYSKVCTHAGCPVGLYRQASHQLLCPCHQSVFDVLRGAVPVSGPADVPLPQLPVRIDDGGYVVALGDYLGRVGPPSWSSP